MKPEIEAALDRLEALIERLLAGGYRFSDNDKEWLARMACESVPAPVVAYQRQRK
jgi:hypothetical protein